MTISVIAGLGNPGPEYARTRHNIGFLLVDHLAEKAGASWKHEAKFRAEVARARIGRHTVWLLKPLTYMNDSGTPTGSFLRFHKLGASALLACYDEIQFRPGECRLSLSGSAGGHNGVDDLLRRLGGSFARLRLGVGPRHPPEIDLKDFVLGRFYSEEEAAVQEALPRFAEAVRLVLDRGPRLAQNEINRKPEPPAKKSAEPPEPPSLSSDSPSSAT